MIQKLAHQDLEENLNIYQVFLAKNNDRLANNFKLTFCRECKPYFVGVWDTVKLLGHFRDQGFPDNKLNPDVAYAYHALSIDEQRKHFYPSLWDEKHKINNQVVEQVWFAGAHSDVGGWYPDRALSDISLNWMIQKAASHELKFKAGWENRLSPNPYGILYPSKTLLWRLLELIPNKIYLRSVRSIPAHANIHASALKRLQKKEMAYSPMNLPDEYKIYQDT